jgi:hypothetical protein
MVLPGANLTPGLRVPKMKRSVATPAEDLLTVGGKCDGGGGLGEVLELAYLTGLKQIGRSAFGWSLRGGTVSCEEEHEHGRSG